MPIQVGLPAPHFDGDAVLPNGEFGRVSLDDYKGRWVVLFFYPYDFTFVCPTEIRAFSAHHAEFVAAGAEVVGCSVDSKFSHKAWIEGDLGAIKYPLLSDFTKEIARRYNVLIEEDGRATRGTFIIAPDGTLRVYLVTHGEIGRSVKETLRLLEAAKLDYEGKMVPCEWVPGDATL